LQRGLFFTVAVRRHPLMTDLEAIADRYFCHLLDGQS